MKFTKYKCGNCHNIIQSQYEGNYVQCACGDSFVDQTKYYIRVGGPAEMCENTIEEDLQELYAEQDLQEKTELFWYLQMQLLDSSTDAVQLIARGLVISKQYNKNHYTPIIKNFLFKKLNSKEFECLATHIALQLSKADIYE